MNIRLLHEGLAGERRDVHATAFATFSTDPSLEDAGADLGLFGIGTDEDAGGAGGTLGDFAAVAEAAGAALSATAAGWHAGLVGPLLARDPGNGELVGRIARGEARIAVPVGAARAVATSRIRVSADQAIVSGECLVVGATPTHVAVPLLLGGTQAVGVLAVDGEQVLAEPVLALDRSRTWSRVTVAGLALGEVAGRVEGIDLFDEWRARIGLLAALDAAGTARVALERTLRHASERKQFGRAIGSFQAYKHRCATAFIDLRLAQSIAFRAAEQLGTPGGRALAYSAALTSTERATRICGEAVQLHGGIGFTWEAGLHAHLKRARADEIIANGGTEAAALLIQEYRRAI